MDFIMIYKILHRIISTLTKIMHFLTMNNNPTRTNTLKFYMYMKVLEDIASFHRKLLTPGINYPPKLLMHQIYYHSKHIIRFFKVVRDTNAWL